MSVVSLINPADENFISLIPTCQTQFFSYSNYSLQQFDFQNGNFIVPKGEFIKM